MNYPDPWKRNGSDCYYFNYNETKDLNLEYRLDIIEYRILSSCLRSGFLFCIDNRRFKILFSNFSSEYFSIIFFFDKNSGTINILKIFMISLNIILLNIK